MVKALRRRAGGLEEHDAIALLDRAARLYDSAVRVANRNTVELWAARTGGPLNIPAELRDEICASAPGERDEDYDETLSWVFYVKHLR